MFEKFIIALMRVLSVCLKELERAYYETYGDKVLAEEFNAEVKQRKRKNKETFIKVAANYIGSKILEQDNFLIPENIALKMGEMMFESAKQEGKIDILNNSIE